MIPHRPAPKQLRITTLQHVSKSALQIDFTDCDCDPQMQPSWIFSKPRGNPHLLHAQPPCCNIHGEQIIRLTRRTAINDSKHNPSAPTTFNFFIPLFQLPKLTQLHGVVHPKLGALPYKIQQTTIGKLKTNTQQVATPYKWMNMNMT